MKFHSVVVVVNCPNQGGRRGKREERMPQAQEAIVHEAQGRNTRQ